MIVTQAKHRYFWDVPERKKKPCSASQNSNQTKTKWGWHQETVLNPISLWGLGIWLRGSQRCHSLHKTHNTILPFSTSISISQQLVRRKQCSVQKRVTQINYCLRIQDIPVLNSHPCTLPTCTWLLYNQPKSSVE